MQTTKTILLQMCFLGFFLSAFAGESGESWDQWRGPRRDGSVVGTEWPTSIQNLEQTWRIPLGKGYPGPIVTPNFVFVVETIDARTVGVRALGRKTGEQIWQSTWAGEGSVPFFADANGDWVRSTPVWDGETLYVGDMAEVLVALNGATGEEQWRINFPERFGTRVPDFGFVCSPLLDGDYLYLQAANSVIKLHRQSGEIIWRGLENSGQITASGAFSSPIITTLQDKRQLLVQTRENLVGVDLANGEVLWSQLIPHFRGMNILTPGVYGNHIFTSGYRNGSYMIAIRRDGEQFRAEQKWTYKGSGYMSSPVIIQNHVYLLLGNSRLDCINLDTGKSAWRSSERFGKYISMVYQDDKILALSDEGMLYLMQANPQNFQLLDAMRVADAETWAHIAISNDEIFIRELQAITAFRWQSPESVSVDSP